MRSIFINQTTITINDTNYVAHFQLSKKAADPPVAKPWLLPPFFLLHHRHKYNNYKLRNAMPVIISAPVYFFETSGEDFLDFQSLLPTLNCQIFYQPGFEVSVNTFADAILQSLEQLVDFHHFKSPPVP
jgi:hypothetical protein